VTDVHAFVTEAAVHVIDTFHAAHHETLQIEFRSDSEVEINVKRVVMRDEGLRVRAARDRVQHRGFDFEEAVLRHEVADRRDHLGTRDEAVARHVIRHQIDVTLAVDQFRIRDALMLVGKRTDRLREETKRLDVNGEFTRLRLEEIAGGADDITHVPGLEVLVRLFAERVARDEVLDRAGHVLHGEEGDLAHHALQHDAAGGLNLNLFGSLKRFAVFGVVLRVQIGKVVLAAEIVRVGGVRVAEQLQLGAALSDDVILFCGGIRFRRNLLFFSHFSS